MIKTKDKVYLIGGSRFALKPPDEFTIDEQDTLNEYFARLETNGNIISGSYSSDDIRNILEMILLPKGKTDVRNVAGKAKQKTVMEVLKDFFLQTAVLGFNIKKYLNR